MNKAKEREVSTAFLNYLSGAGEFTNWVQHKETFRENNVHLNVSGTGYCLPPLGQ